MYKRRTEMGKSHISEHRASLLFLSYPLVSSAHPNMIFIATILLAAVAAVNCQVPPRDYRPGLYYDESPKPYAFNYNALLEDGVGSIGRSETADGSGRVQGSYSLTNDEGHSRHVDYVADQNGFRANIRTNEPGTDNQNPADVIIESSAAGALAYRPAAIRRPLGEPIAAPEVIPEPVVPHPAPYRRPVVPRYQYRPTGR